MISNNKGIAIAIPYFFLTLISVKIVYGKYILLL
nr:MAG TPA: hypothetical protein [Myoviridae sp. ctNPX13]